MVMIDDENGDVHLNSVSSYSQNKHPNGVQKQFLLVQTQKPTFQFLLRIVTKEFNLFSHVRGVLGNKCTGHHNLKTIKIREIMCK